MVVLMSLLNIALEAASHESGNVNLVSILVGGGALLILLIALFGVMSFGKGRGHN